ncbi:S8 family peptidase [Lacrimispora sp. 210928-DFI.3.58]|uniref:S8 family peptidase n=1 Tax=Lacrimispora sp. 210928-DFI.3.58 TaxID=2883214 RepID=UPI001D090FE0|nr:S8 family peptidase [Lacrimispora sp. 210928-DFI.3.58]MCB7319594.1 S8 family peptidase [Lacrimispora sp. 210928-DFI.3.58]
MAACPFNPASENIADFIFRYGSRQQIPGNPADIPCMDYVSQDYAVIYTPLESVAPISLRKYSYYSIPSLFALLDTTSMEASGILSTFNAPALANKGKGVLIGFIDTGIDYTNPLFRNPDGSTRIVSIWDQSLPADSDSLPPGVPDLYPASGANYGTEFTREQINEALASDSPLSVVPSTDTNGHGTFLAGIAAGASLPEEDFTGAAPESELVVVKLKPAKQYLRDFYLVREGAEAFQENDVMMGIKYMRVAAYRLGRPLVILLGLGTNLGSHEATSPLSLILQDVSRTLGMATVIAAGNETGMAHHYEGTVKGNDQWEDVEIRVGPEEAEHGFVLELWAAAADTYSVGFVTPSGQTVDRIPIIYNNEPIISFLLEPTRITVNYILIETGSGRQMVFIRFEKPTVGVWKVRVYSSQFFTGAYNMWLPPRDHISDDTVFLLPNPNTTITIPGNTSSPITVGAYNHLNNSIYIHSSRGYTASGIIKPDIAAPGVDVSGPSLARRPGAGVPMTQRTGTSVAAAHVAGAVAGLLGWGIVDGNTLIMSEASIKSYLIRGAGRNPAFTYPNREWGYGTLDLYQTFLRLRE